ncbi:uncharacterized protein LOC118481300 [Helianthus annuus]|uniref:uncharacterized protein LOC118481300 n=1 Tax=Helianthus annuus TaxID=4232 RepID=UPI0016531A56|nr:uncharacterized protein LOC118481300 [Helianthus annuus]
MEPSSVKLLSGSAVHSTMGSGMGSHNFEAVPSSFSSAPAPELHVPEYSSVPKIRTRSACTIFVFNFGSHYKYHGRTFTDYQRFIIQKGLIDFCPGFYYYGLI